MRSGDSPGSSAESNNLTLLHLVALLHIKFRQVHVHGHKSESVVDHYAVPLVIELARENHLARVGGMNRSARRRTEVSPTMYACQLSVKGPAGTVVLRDVVCDRRHELSRPFRSLKQVSERRILDLLFHFNALQCLGIGSDILLWNCQPRSLILCCFHRNV